MSDVPRSLSTATPCSNCGQPTRAGAERCLWCGAASAAIPAPTAAAPPSGPVPQPEPAGPLPHPVPERAEGESKGQAPQAEALRLAPLAQGAGRPPRAGAALPPALVGRVAGVPRQLLAWLIDVLATAGIAVAVLAGTGSPVLAVVVAVEVAVVQWVAEGRTGATLGGLATRSRQTRADRPFSPGVWRAAAARGLRAGGFVLGLGVGVVVVVASGLADGSGQRRSWSDRAAGTRRVALLGRAEQSQAVPVPAPAVIAAPTLAAPPVAIADDLELSAGTTGDPVAVAPAPALAPAVVPLAVAPAPAPSPLPEADQAPAAVAGMVAPDVDLPAGIESTVMTALPAGVSTLLLVFDTGQRESVRTPGAANLGRAPVATDPADHRIVVHDPESSVSKTHVRVEHSRGQTWVTDMRSTNGTRILGDDGSVRALAPGERRELEEGERVRIGNRSFTVNLVVAAAAAEEEL